MPSCRCPPLHHRHLQITTHQGITGQVQLWTGLPHGAVQLLFAGLVLHGLAGALLPNSPTYSDENIKVRRPLLCCAC